MKPFRGSLFVGDCLIFARASKGLEINMLLHSLYEGMGMKRRIDGKGSHGSLSP